MNRRLPVTLVGGFLGAGKTSLLHHLISEHRGGNLAVLVESPGAINPDAKALRGLCGVMRRLSDTVLEIPAADEATQVEWVASQLRELAEIGRFERVFIEVGGTSSPAWLARHFGLLPVAELRQIICVIDALDFFRREKKPESKDSWRDFQDEQIASASLLVLNKCDLVEDKERADCTRFLREINPEAQIIETAYGEIPAEVLARPGIPQELGSTLERGLRLRAGDNGVASEKVLPSLSSSLYRARRPFHPQRFWDWFSADHPGLLR